MRPQKFAPQERYVASCLWSAAAVSAIYYALTTGAATEKIFMGAIALIAISRALLALRRYTVVTKETVLDVSGLSAKEYSTKQLVALWIGRGRGLVNGYRIHCSLADGREVALRGTRVYSVIPSPQQYRDLERFMSRLAHDLKIPTEASQGPS